MMWNERIQEISKNKEHPVVFICGLGGSGKTSFAKYLAAQHENSRAVQLDWYLRFPSKERKVRIKAALDCGDDQRIAAEENPQNWYDWDSFHKDVLHLQKTGTLSMSNAWNQKTGEKNLSVEINFESRPGLVVCEGIYLLHPEVTAFSDLTILINISKEESRRRADQRDSHRSDPQYLAYKAALMEKYDVPYFAKNSKNADLVLIEKDLPELSVMSH